MTSAMALYEDGDKILMIGDARVGKRFLLTRMLGTTPLTFVPFSIPLVGSASNRTPTHVHFQVARWPIDTRYYHAHLDIHVLRDEEIGDFTPELVASLLQPVMFRSQGVLLVYDATRPDTWHRLKRWAALLQAHAIDDGVLVAVANHTTRAQPVSDALHEEARDWCLDHGIEHVIVKHEGGSGDDVADDGDDEDDDDVDGIPRLIQAFHSNMWPRATLKPRDTASSSIASSSSAPFGGARSSDDVAASDEEDDDDHEDDGDDDDDEDDAKHDQANGSEKPTSASFADTLDAAERELIASIPNPLGSSMPPQPSTTTTTSSLSKSQRKRQRRKRNAGASTTTASSSSSSTTATAQPRAAAPNTSDMSEEALERELVAFESLFERMRSVRSQALADSAASGGGAEVSESALRARRERAAEAIMSLMSQLGLEDD